MRRGKRIGAIWTVLTLSMVTAICLTGGLSVSQAAGDETLEPVDFQIPAIVVVQGPKIHLCDLGTMEGTIDTDTAAEIAKVDLGTAPPPGRERQLTKEYLEFILKQHRLNSKITLNMNRTVLIKADATCIPAFEIKDLVEKQLPAKNPEYLSRTLEFVNLPPELWLEKGEYQLNAVPLGKIPEFGTAVFRVEITSNGVKKKSINLCGKIRVTAKIYQASRNISPKEAVTDADFNVRVQELTSGREVFGQFPAGSRTIRTINSGEILEKQDIQVVPAVSKDSEVGVSVTVEGVEITIKAIARADAWIGDEIQLFNPSSKKIFKGRVVGKNSVEVRTQ